MKLSTALTRVAVLATIACISACTTSNYKSETQSVPDAKTVTTDQAAWKTLTAQADAALKSGDKAGAEKFYKEAALEAEKMAIETNASAESLANLANFYYAQGDGAKADEVYKKALAIHEKALGLEHIDLVKDLIGLAKIAHSQGKDDEAIAYYQRAKTISERAKQPFDADATSDYQKLLDAQKTAAPSDAASKAAPAK